MEVKCGDWVKIVKIDETVPTITDYSNCIGSVYEVLYNYGDSLKLSTEEHGEVWFMHSECELVPEIAKVDHIVKPILENLSEEEQEAIFNYVCGWFDYDFIEEFQTKIKSLEEEVEILKDDLDDMLTLRLGIGER